MKIVCDRVQLYNAISGVSKAIVATSALPIIEGVLMECENGTLTLTGYDLEMVSSPPFPQTMTKTAASSSRQSSCRTW